MFRFSKISAALAIFLALVGCATTTLEAVSDYDRNFDFSPAQRFFILPIDRTTAAEKLISDMQVERIDEALAAEIERRGYGLAKTKEDADLYISWHLVTRERTDIRSYNASSAYQCWRCGPPVSDVSVKQYTEGTFIVDLIDPLRNRSVWRSRIESRLKTDLDAQQSADLRTRAAKAVLAPYPPAPGGAE